MVASEPRSRPTRRFYRRLWFWVAAPIGLLVGLLVGVSWWFTEPLEDRGRVESEWHVAARPASASTVAEAEAEPPAAPELAWPEERLDGDAAKDLLLAVLEEDEAQLRRIAGYTCIFRKRERLRGKLGDEQAMHMKVRNAPFAVYLKFIRPSEGKEVVYCEGRHENKVIAHNTGVSRFVLPRLAVPPDHPIALAESRHPITDAGLLALTRKLVRFRKLDLDDPDAVTILDRVPLEGGKTLLRSVHTHSRQDGTRPFARVEVLYDPDTKLPIEITSFDWPAEGQGGELALAEHYEYDDLNLEAPLSDLDFDPANPAYAFHRY